MTRVRIGLLAACIASGLVGSALAPPALAAPAAVLPETARLTDAEILAILKTRIDDQKQGVGIVVGIVGPAGRRVVAHGAVARGDARPVDGDTVFEAQSITKVFTGLLLADMARTGQVKLDDPVARYMPRGVVVPSRNGRQITLSDLATHTSGLPTDGGFKLVPGTLQVADYTNADMYDFLRAYSLQTDIGSTWIYSNLGFGLLGHALERRAGTGLPALMRARLLEPLKMKSSSLAPGADLIGRMAAGYDSCGLASPATAFKGGEGSWGLRTTVNDLMNLLQAELDSGPEALRPAMAVQLETRRPLPSPAFAQALGWDARRSPSGATVFSKEGAGHGYHSYIAFDPAARTGVVILANMQGEIVDIARHILEGTSLAAPRPPTPGLGDPPEVALDPAVLARYVGSYELGRTHADIVLEGGRLYGQIVGQPKLAMAAENERTFFVRGLNMKASFEFEPGGGVKGLLLRQNCRESRWTRAASPGG